MTVRERCSSAVEHHEAGEQGESSNSCFNFEWGLSSSSNRLKASCHPREMTRYIIITCTLVLFMLFDIQDWLESISVSSLLPTSNDQSYYVGITIMYLGKCAPASYSHTQWSIHSDSLLSHLQYWLVDWKWWPTICGMDGFKDDKGISGYHTMQLGSSSSCMQSTALAFPGGPAISHCFWFISWLLKETRNRIQRDELTNNSHNKQEWVAGGPELLED